MARLTLKTHFLILRRVWAASDRLNLGLVSAGVAFYALVSIFPAIAAIIAIWGYFSDPQELQNQLDIAQQLLPDDAFNIVKSQIVTLVNANNSTLQVTSLVSIMLAVWTSRNGVSAMIRGLNAVHRLNNRKNPLRRYFVAILLTFVLILVAIFAFAAVIILPSVFAFFTISPEIELMISVIKWIVALGVVFFGIAVLYRYGPNGLSPRPAWFTVGTAVALVVWAGGSVAFSTYLRNFGNFNEVYGSLGAVIALLFWFYISAFVVLLGAQLNFERQRVLVD